MRRRGRRLISSESLLDEDGHDRLDDLLGTPWITVLEGDVVQRRIGAITAELDLITQLIEQKLLVTLGPDIQIEIAHASNPFQVRATEQHPAH